MSSAEDGRADSGGRNPRAAEMADYLDARLQMFDGDEPAIARALLLVAELHGIDRVAAACGLNAETMRRQLNGTRPLHFDTVMGVVGALGIRLRVTPSAT